MSSHWRLTPDDWKRRRLVILETWHRRLADQVIAAMK